MNNHLINEMSPIPVKGRSSKMRFNETVQTTRVAFWNAKNSQYQCPQIAMLRYPATPDL
jgi:hypothetical protein